jgi:uncharacterized cupin superfamily protein
MTAPIPQVLLFSASRPEPQHWHAAPERHVEGNPRQTAWNHYTDTSSAFSAGVWEAEPGAWRVQYTEDEYCEILAGISVLTADDGTVVTVRAGDRFVVPAGFSGTWRVVETTRKVYVIHERTGPAA